MAHCSTLMGQLLQLIPRHVFDHLVDTHAWQGPNPRKLTYWSHLGAMLFGQWSARKSLRDLAFSLKRQARKFYHLGLTAVPRSTLADANQQRPAVIFEKTYYKLYERVSAALAQQPQEAPKIKIIDATTIDLCAAVFPWAKFRSRKGAIKLHTVLTGMLPQCVLVTDGKTHDRRAVQDMHFGPDDLLIFDRAYLDYAWLYRLHQGSVWFVTRLKTNSCFEVTQRRAASGPVLADQIIRLSSPQGQACYPELLRRVHYRDPETGQEYAFLTNRLDLSALEVAELYRRRWQIELFFKWIKQNLKIKAFYGTSKNAVLIQIWTALIAYVLLVWLKFKSKVAWGLIELTRLAQTMLMERCDLWAILCPRPPDNRQPLLFN
ncbi:MAG: IS4 family transposase [Desulfobaccales bacterium]